VVPSRGGPAQPRGLLTADAFGVLPPIAQAHARAGMYHFLSGYTPRSRHRARPSAPNRRPPSAPASAAPSSKARVHLCLALLGEVSAAPAPSAGSSHRLDWRPLRRRRRMTLRTPAPSSTAALPAPSTPSPSNATPLRNRRAQVLPRVPAAILDARSQWPDRAAYDRAALDLAARFNKNFREILRRPARKSPSRSLRVTAIFRGTSLSVNGLGRAGRVRLPQVADLRPPLLPLRFPGATITVGSSAMAPAHRDAGRPAGPLMKPSPPLPRSSAPFLPAAAQSLEPEQSASLSRPRRGHPLRRPHFPIFSAPRSSTAARASPAAPLSRSTPSHQSANFNHGEDYKLVAIDGKASLHRFPRRRRGRQHRRVSAAAW